MSGLIYLALLGIAQPASAEEAELMGENRTSPHGAYSPALIVEPGRNHQFYHHAAVSLPVDSPHGIDAEQQPKLISLNNLEKPHAQREHAEFAALREYAQLIEQPEHLSNEDSRAHPQFEHPEFAALREYSQQIGADQPNSDAAPRFRMAEADNALDALREYLRRGAQPDASPGAPEPTPDSPGRARRAPGSIPNAMPHPPRAAAPMRAQSFGEAHYLGTTTCLICHTSQADSFGKTLMGRIGKTQPGKFDCENCHGPASVHIKAGGCAACHGETVSRKPGIPTLAGQDPQYLVPAMKGYISGGRKHELMKEILSGVGEADLNGIALYYSRQAPARAQTPPVGDPVAGKAASTLCAWCHGEHGISTSPHFPNLAGQDAQYLASAVKAYKDGSRSKTVACAWCHGERGVSQRPGVPNLAGQDPQYLLRTMKAYVAGNRKQQLMSSMITGLSDAELEKIALHYSQQIPARAQTPLVGDPVAGKAAAEVCVGCHGDKGIVSSSPGVNSSPEFPNLAGQESQYLANALRAYKQGPRDNETMHGMAETVEDSAINDIASYWASLPTAQLGADAAKIALTTPDPVVVKNIILASRDERTTNNIVSYFASLRPAGAKSGPAVPQPMLVGQAAHIGGLSLGSIISFRKNDPGRRTEQNNAICLGCHERGGRNYWSGSTHETRDVACTECHTIMQAISRKANLKTENEPDTCFQCHKDRRAQLFRSSHMPLREGKIVCSNCHNPHGSATEALLIESSINNTCYKCHAEKRGPFLFEHTPVRENCLNCHDPHGSVNEYLLKLSRPRLCAECHTVDHGTAIAGGPKMVTGFGRACQNCHTKVHGTNSPSGALLQR